MLMQKINAYNDIRPANDEFRFTPHKERVETKVIDTDVQPALAWHPVLPVTAGIIYEKINMGFKLQCCVNFTKTIPLYVLKGEKK